MRFGDTLSADKFEGFKFDYCISTRRSVIRGIRRLPLWRKS